MGDIIMAIENNKYFIEKIKIILDSHLICPFEYWIEDNRLLIFDSEFNVISDIDRYMDYLAKESMIYDEDKWKMIDFLTGKMNGPIEIRAFNEHKESKYILDASMYLEKNKKILVGSIRDTTHIKQRDSLTNLYNHETGKVLISEYLEHKNPYATCALIIVDIDYFKRVNDVYGHLVGDNVLKKMARLLSHLFKTSDIIARIGGDEFVILIKDIKHASLVKKMMELIKSVSKLRFDEDDLIITCSAGVCYLPENIAGLNYDQIFKNADWGLYRAKENGRNQYVFCDNLHRFETMIKDNKKIDIDTRYLHNDVVATAFEIFEKAPSFPLGIKKLFKIVGLKYDLDRISIIHTNIKNKVVSKQYQWVKEGVPEVLSSPSGFKKEDFLTLFNSYNEYGVMVLQNDHMEMYSKEAADLLMQGEAKTVVYAAMYCQGKYTGAVSYVTCRNKREWSEQSLFQLGELTKIISAHLEKHLAINEINQSIFSEPNYDFLTGLISFPKFREEVERLIVGEHAGSNIIIYTDFQNFTYINQKYGYATGDQLLKEFTHYIIKVLGEDEEVYFTRVVSDQFIIFLPYDDIEHVEKNIQAIYQGFVDQCMQTYPDMKLRIRAGIYRVDDNCMSASVAFDAANYARKSIASNSNMLVKLYDEKLHQKKQLEQEIISEIDQALKNHEFKVYMQPIFSLENYTIVAAEALVRWIRPNGEVLQPSTFIPIYEANGRIIDLDFYVFEEVVKSLAKCKQLKKRIIPVSINASILHAHNKQTTQIYMDILKKYDIDPSLIEIELTETDTIKEDKSVAEMFDSLNQARIKTALDDFGAGYSVLNSVLKMSIDTIKIDRVFIKNCEQNQKGVYFLQQLIDIFQQLGYKVICEGIETQKQIDIIKSAGCKLGQGFYFSRPLPLEEYENRL